MVGGRPRPRLLALLEALEDRFDALHAVLVGALRSSISSTTRSSGSPKPVEEQPRLFASSTASSAVDCFCAATRRQTRRVIKQLRALRHAATLREAA